MRVHAGELGSVSRRDISVLPSSVMTRSYQAEVAKLAPLSTFDMRAFVADDKTDQACCDFVLALALAFNDIKDVLLGDHLLLGEVSEDQKTPTRPLGAFSGLHFHFFRILLGILHELLYLIKTDSAVLEKPLFRGVVHQLPKTARAAWKKLVESSLADSSRDPDIAFLVKARNAVAYHYGPKAIGQGFRRAFAADTEEAFISRGSSIASTRLYFADRAAQSYLQQVFGEDELERYFLKQPKLISDIAGALVSIVKAFVQARGYAWREHAG